MIERVKARKKKRMGEGYKIKIFVCKSLLSFKRPPATPANRSPAGTSWLVRDNVRSVRGQPATPGPWEEVIPGHI